SQRTTFATASSGGASPFIGVPVNSVSFLLGNPAAPFGPTAITFDPNPANFRISGTTQLYGGDFNFIYTLHGDECGCCQLLIGYRNLNLRESLNMNIDVIDPTLGTPAINIADGFTTKNDFNGAQIGTRWNCVCNKFLFELTFKLGLGNMSSTLSVNG